VLAWPSIGEDPMSVYRSIQRTLANDVFATPVTEKIADRNGAAAPSAPVAAPDVAESAHPRFMALRKREQPRNVLLEHTARWATSLPDAVRPHALLRGYPRIANMIALLWLEPTSDAFNRYMDTLFVDQRGKRKGFPPAVVTDLLDLREHYEARRTRRI
jgi:hypothetical protein